MSLITGESGRAKALKLNGGRRGLEVNAASGVVTRLRVARILTTFI